MPQSEREPHAGTPLPVPDHGDELVRRVLAGETEAFVEIVRRHQREIFGIVSRLLADRVTTENLVQQCFLNAYERLEQYRLGADLGRWLRGIARNLVKEELRRAARERRRLGRYRDYLEVRLQDSERAGEHERRLEAAVAACRERLAPASARAVELRYLEALSLEEVAGALGRTLGATRQLLCRAREAIRTCAERKLAAE